MVLAAQSTVENGRYEVSRLPGHPLQEFIYLLNPYGSYFYYNLLAAVFSTIAVIFFALILKKLDIRGYIPGALALAFTPVFYTSSTYTIDYTWSLAFILASFYFLLCKKLIASGILLGMAVGCRITSGAMLIPFSILLFDGLRIRKENLEAVLKMALPAILTSGLLFIPILNRYGPGFFMYYDQFDYPPLTKVFYKDTIGVFGLVGIGALVYAATLFFLRKQETA